MTNNEKLDLVLKGGHVVDPANQIDAPHDVGIRDGKIARVEEDIPTDDATQSVDVSGLSVVPGLLDIHIHAYWTRRLNGGDWGGSLNADAHFLKEGVTTCVDTGTAGWQEIAHFKESVIDRSKCRVLAYVNIAGPGMGEPEQDVSNLDAKAAAAAAEGFKEVVVGIKTAHYWVRLPFDAAHPAWASVDKSVEAGVLCDMPVMVDFWPRPPERPYDALLLEHLRPGDIHTHVFARQFPIVDAQRKVYDYMFKARQRGIHFDLGHGAASFWYRNGAPAIAQGFPPDSISTDLHMGSINGHVHSMPDTMSKCLAMGMPFQEVIYRSTVTPASAIRRPELGTLSVGAEADVAVLKREQGAFTFHDCGWTRINGTERLECRMTLRRGEIVWDRHGLSVPDWQYADEGYWAMPGDTWANVPRLWR
jgi:dihydroorotase